MPQVKRLTVITAAVFLLIAATAANLHHVYYMAATLALLPLVSGVVGYLNLRGLRFEREVPAVAWEGETARLTLHCHSTARTPRLFLRAADATSQWLEPEHDEPPMFNALPGRTTRVEYGVHLLKRGLHRIDGLHVFAFDPLGLVTFQRTYPVNSEVLVYPRPQRIPNVLLTGAERFGYRDMPIAASRGTGVDFDGVREYVPGDPLRRMHWKSFARTGRLNIVEFEESRAVSLVLALDLRQGTNVGEGTETTLEYLIRAAASIAQLGIREGASVRLVAGDAADPANAPGRGTDHLLTILSCLARSEATDPHPIRERLGERVGRIPAGTSLIVLTATPDPALAEAVLHYTSAGAHSLLVFADPGMYAPPSRRAPSPTADAFLHRIASVGCIPLVVNPAAGGTLLLQHVLDGAGDPGAYAHG